MMKSFFAVGIQGLIAVRMATALTEKLAVSTIIRLGSSVSVCKDQLIDAVILQDSSGSLYDHQWNQILKASTQLVDALDLGDKKSRVAPVSFSTGAHVHWQLDDIQAKDAQLANEEIMNIPLISEGTNTANGLMKAHEVFLKMNSADPARYKDKDLIRLLFIITDGCSSSSTPLQMKSSTDYLNSIPNLIVLFVGVGKNVCEDEMRSVAGCKPLATGEACSNVRLTQFAKMPVDVPIYIAETCQAIADFDTTGEREGGGNGTEDEDQQKKSEGSNHAGVIAGGVIGGLALLGMAGGGIAYKKFKSGKKDKGGNISKSSSAESGEDVWEDDVSAEAAGSMHA